jgi:hypothetical protein
VLVPAGITYKGIRKQRYTKQGIRKQGIRSKVYLTTQPNCGRNTPLEFLTWNMKLWPFSHPLMSQSKNFNPNLFLGRFQCRLSGVTITRSGATPASAVTSPSRILTRPVHGSITRHSDIKSTTRSACSRQTRHPTTSLPETKSAHSSFGAPLRASRQSQ